MNQRLIFRKVVSHLCESVLLFHFNLQELPPVTRALVLALGVCYHACLKNRDNYRNSVTMHFKQPCILPGGAEQMLEEIVW